MPRAEARRCAAAEIPGIIPRRRPAIQFQPEDGRAGKDREQARRRPADRVSVCPAPQRRADSITGADGRVEHQIAFLQPALPDRDRTYFSAGVGYIDPASKWHWDLGYSYVRYAGRIPIDRAGPTGDTLRGEFDVGGHVVAAQVGYSF